MNDVNRLEVRVLEKAIQIADGQMMAGRFLEQLVSDTLEFWLDCAPDREYGGFFNYVDSKGQVFCSDKPVWVLCRFTWLLSMLSNELGDRGRWLETAGLGYDFIDKHCFDDDGRMFFELDRQGRALRKRRYVFSEAFGVMALSEYGKAVGDERILQRGRDLFGSLLRYYEQPGLLEPKINPQVRPGKSHAMTMIMVSVCQQMRRVYGGDEFDRIIDGCIAQIVNDFMHPELAALLEVVGPDGSVVDGAEGTTVNPGHAIETAWFIMEEGRYRGQRELIDTGLTILGWSLDMGWDKEFGGILYFVDAVGKPATAYEHDMKLWWPHTEAIYATLLGYYLTGEGHWLGWYERVYQYAYSHFPDKDNGEWFKYLHRDGTVSSPVKGNTWAGPFHLPRMQYKCYELLKHTL